MKLNDLEVHKSSLERLIRHELLNKEDPFAAQNEIAQKWSHLQKNVSFYTFHIGMLFLFHNKINVHFSRC